MNKTTPTSAIYTLIGQRVYYWRNERGFSQQELANRVQVARCSIANIEAGRQRATLGLLYRICGALEVGIYEIIPGRYELPD